MNRDQRLLEECGVDTDNGGSYRLPKGTVLTLRPLVGLDVFGGDRSAYIEYAIHRDREYRALVDGIRDHASKKFAEAFAAEMRKS